MMPFYGELKRDEPRSRTRVIGEFKGFELTLFGSISYCCDGLGLRGFRSEQALKRAITKALKG